MIFVTGGEGFIGRHVSSVLSAHGKKVIAVDLNVPHEPIINKPYISLECDIRDKNQLEKIFQQYSFTTIIHLASLLNTASRKYPKQATEINISGSLNILEAANKFGISKVIYGSSISVYGSQSCHTQDGVSETDPAVPEDIYGAAKRYVEILGDIYRRRYGIQFISLRIASVIGPGTVKTASRWRSDIVEKLGLSEPTEIPIPYQKEAIIPFVYVEDVAKIFKCLVDAEHTKFTVYNTPAETWVLYDLAKYLTSNDNNLSIRFGQSCVTGIPRVINAQRFVEEFNFCTMPLKERLNHISLLNKSKTIITKTLKNYSYKTP